MPLHTQLIIVNARDWLGNRHKVSVNGDGLEMIMESVYYLQSVKFECWEFSLNLTHLIGGCPSKPFELSSEIVKGRS